MSDIADAKHRWRINCLSGFDFKFNVSHNASKQSTPYYTGCRNPSKTIFMCVSCSSLTLFAPVQPFFLNQFGMLCRHKKCVPIQATCNESSRQAIKRNSKYTITTGVMPNLVVHHPPMFTINHVPPCPLRFIQKRMHNIKGRNVRLVQYLRILYIKYITLFSLLLFISR